MAADFGDTFPSNPYGGQRFSKSGVLYEYHGSTAGWVAMFQDPAPGDGSSGSSGYDFFESFVISALKATSFTGNSPWWLSGGSFASDFTTSGLKYTVDASGAGARDILELDWGTLPDGFDYWAVEYVAQTTLPSPYLLAASFIYDAQNDNAAFETLQPATTPDGAMFRFAVPGTSTGIKITHNVQGAGQPGDQSSSLSGWIRVYAAKYRNGQKV